MPPFPSFQFTQSPPEPKYYVLDVLRTRTKTHFQQLFMYYPYEQDNVHMDVQEVLSSLNDGNTWHYSVTAISREIFESIMMKRQAEIELLKG